MGDFLPKIIKCLELTTSEYDGEALNAIRKANHFRKEMKKSWAEIFTLPSKKSPDYSPRSPLSDDEYNRIDEMLESLLEMEDTLTEKTYAFIVSLNKGFQKYKSLTEKQLFALERVYGEHCG